MCIYYCDMYDIIARYLRCHFASEGIVMLGRHHTVCVCVCSPSHLYHVSTARRIVLGGEGNALYPVLSSYVLCGCITVRILYLAKKKSGSLFKN